MISARSLLQTWAAFSLLMALPCQADLSNTLSSDIAPQPLARALQELSSQTGLQLIYVSDIASMAMSRGAPRGLTTHDALDRLLDGTGLRYEYLNERTVRIFADPNPHPQNTGYALTTAATMRTARRAQLAALEEIVVTATRREEQLRDVPISAAVWTQEAMEASGIKGIDQIGELTPGVEFDTDSRVGDSYTNLVIRGVTDMHGTATSVFLNDTPLPPGRGETYHRMYPVAFDLDRIEVLRGPQGGLLGQDALGGAVRFVVNEPSLTTYSGLARTEISSTADGDPSFEAGAALGGPITPDVLGFRLSGWYRSDGGYVDRVTTQSGRLDPTITGVAEENVNDSTSQSVRAALTWEPSASWRITPLLVWQSIHYDDPSSFYLHLSNPEDGVLASGSQTQQPSDDEYYLGSLRLAATSSKTDLLAVASYLRRDFRADIDLSPYESTDPTSAFIANEEEVLSFEARLNSADPEAALRWIAGLWYSNSHVRDDNGSTEDFEDFDRQTQTDRTQLAGFGQVSFRFGQRVTALAGVRVGRSHYDSVTTLPPTTRAEDTGTSVTPRFGITYQGEGHGLFYATVAKGHRDGGVYAPFWGCGYGPAPYAADSLWSYEIGAKSSLLDRRVDLDASVFHITWGNNEAPFGADCSPNNYRPVSAAVSNGVNFALRAYPNERARIGLALAYLDAHYTETVTLDGAVVIRNGDALGSPPNVPAPWSFTASVEHDFTLSPGVTLTARAEDIYHSENPGPFYTQYPASAYYSPDRRTDPATNMLNLRATVAWSRFDSAIFVNNALDSQPTLMVSNACCTDPLLTAMTFRPRTVGVSVTWRY